MDTRFNPLYTAYGAHALKASYQRNLLIATVMVLSVFGMALTTAWLLSLESETVVIPPGRELPVRADWDSELDESSFDRPPPAGPVVGGISAPVPTDVVVGLPVAVPDSLFSPVEAELPTREDSRNLVNAGLIDGDGAPDDFGLIGGSGEASPVEYVPEPGEFVFHEVEPTFVVHAQPEYPRHLRSIGLGGEVEVQVLVDIDGRVKDARVARSSGHEALDEAAIEAAYKNVFTPALQNGRPVAVWVSYRVVFTTDD